MSFDIGSCRRGSVEESSMISIIESIQENTLTYIIDIIPPDYILSPFSHLSSKG